MASDSQFLCNCCPCCGGPTEFSREAMRRGKRVGLALNFIEGEAIKMASLWNLSRNTEPTLISAKQNLHLFHKTNVLPILEAFYSGAMRDVWLNSDTPGYDANDFPDPMPIGNRDKAVLPAWGKRNQRVDPTDFVVSGEQNSKQSVYWKRPKPAPGFKKLYELVDECVDRSGECSNIPILNVTVPGCKMCNDIMTQQATSSHFLVRMKISDTPLVSLKSILTYKIVDQGKRYSNSGSDPFGYDPNYSNINKKAKAFNYQGCLGYYIHRCLPPKPPRRLSQAELDKKKGIRKIMVAFSFIVLEVACLTFERFRGLEGGDKPLAKPAFRYRGCSELYLSYLFWVMLSNDIPEGFAPGDPNAGFVSLDFCQFHRYLFCEVVPALAECHSGFANAYELNDVIFGDNDEYFLDRHSTGMMPGSTIPPPHKVMETICNGICKFYTDILRPIFSRHMTNLSPDSYLIGDGTGDDEHVLYNRQKGVSDKLVSVTSLHAVGHLLEKATVGDIDTFVECVGVHTVLWLWQRMLETAPVNVERLMGNFMDSMTLIEYTNIQANASSDPSKPSISAAMAEKIYVMCNAKTLISEPKNEYELQELKMSPMRSPAKATIPLLKVGAFQFEE